MSPVPKTSRHDGGTRREAKLTSGVLGAAPLIAWMQKEVRSHPRRASFSRARFSLIEILLALLILNHCATLNSFSITIDDFFGALKLSVLNESLVKFKKTKITSFSLWGEALVGV